MYDVEKKLKGGGSIRYQTSRPLEVAKHNREIESKKHKVAKKMLSRDFASEGAEQVKKESGKGYRKYLDNKYKH